MYKNYIPKEDIKNYPLIKFDGRIHVIDSASDIAVCLKTISKFTVLGFDTETKPSFKKGVSHNVSLLQIAAGDNVFIFRLNKCGLPKTITRVFSNPAILKVGIDIKNDLLGLKKINSFQEFNFLDLNQLALDKGFKSIGAIKLSIMLLGFRISKKQRLSDWSSDNLTNSQLDYAAIDAWICPKILESFKNRLLYP